jgi:NTE family protein
LRHVIDQLAPRLPESEGYRHTKAVLGRKPWAGEFDPLSGVVLHEPRETTLEAAE